jgi:hypothetical protein
MSAIMKTYEIDHFPYTAETNQVTIVRALGHKDAVMKALHLLGFEIKACGHGDGEYPGLGCMFVTTKGPCFVKLVYPPRTRLEITATRGHCVFYKVYTSRAQTQKGILDAHEHFIKEAQHEMRLKGITWDIINCKTLEA